jgi:membrane protein
MNDHAKNEHAEDWRSHIGEEASSGGRSDDLTRAREPGRGREATTPTDIPASGWKDILWRVLWSIPDDRVLSTSGGVAFFALLAVFPAIATVVSLYGLFADTGTIRGHLSLLAGILPGGVLELIGEQITLIITQDSDTLSLAFVVGSLVALWSANSGVAALFDALNVVYGEKEKRSLLRFYSTTFLLTLGMIGLVMAHTAAHGGTRFSTIRREQNVPIHKDLSRRNRGMVLADGVFSASRLFSERSPLQRQVVMPPST